MGQSLTTPRVITYDYLPSKGMDLRWWASEDMWSALSLIWSRHEKEPTERIYGTPSLPSPISENETCWLPNRNHFFRDNEDDNLQLVLRRHLFEILIYGTELSGGRWQHGVSSTNQHNQYPTKNAISHLFGFVPWPRESRGSPYFFFFLEDVAYA